MILQILARCGAFFIGFIVKGQMNHDFAFGIEVNPCVIEITIGNSPYYNANVKGMKTGTMASSYNIVVLYEKDGKAYLITCLAAHSNEGRYKAVQSAINTIIE